MRTFFVIFFISTMSNCMNIIIIIINTHHRQYDRNAVLVIMIIMAIRLETERGFAVWLCQIPSRRMIGSK